MAAAMRRRPRLTGRDCRDLNANHNRTPYNHSRWSAQAPHGLFSVLLPMPTENVDSLRKGRERRRSRPRAAQEATAKAGRFPTATGAITIGESAMEPHSDGCWSSQQA